MAVVSIFGLLPQVESCGAGIIGTWEAENDDLRQVPGCVFGDGSRSGIEKPERHLRPALTRWHCEKMAKRTQQISSENSFERVRADGKSPRHVDSVRRRLATDILPCLGARPIAGIEAPELVAMIKTIEDRGARDIAKRARETTG